MVENEAFVRRAGCHLAFCFSSRVASGSHSTAEVWKNSEKGATEALSKSESWTVICGEMIDVTFIFRGGAKVRLGRHRELRRVYAAQPIPSFFEGRGSNSSHP